MNTLIKLTDEANNTVYINSQYIEAIYKPDTNKEATCIKMAMGGYEYTVIKSMGEVMDAINKTTRASLKLSSIKSDTQS
jgi:hypothetical protein